MKDKLKLTERMERIVSYCTRCDTIADIGCDHGYVACALALSRRCKRVIASDVSEKSLQKARELARRLQLTDRIYCRHGNGLSVLAAGEAGGIIIAGMGGPLICEILSRGKAPAAAAEYLTLSPNVYARVLRKYLWDTGFEIIRESIVLECGHFYPVIRARYDGRARSYTTRELYFGVEARCDGGYEEYAQAGIEAVAKIVQEIRDGGGDASEKERILAELEAGK